MAVVVQTCKTASITATTPTVDFVDNGDGTVTHAKTGLMWKQCSEGLSDVSCGFGTVTPHTWQGALQQAGVNNTAMFAGFSDWRVPNQKELNSIVERQCATPAINTTIFPATGSLGYWSASPYAGIATLAWFVSFDFGNDNVDNKSFSKYVRLVRGGQ